MKKALLDLNIILDFLSKRDDHEAALAVFDLCIQKNLKGYVSSHEITTLSYFLEKERYPVLKRNKIINSLLDHLTVLTAHEKILRDALESEINDYEDAVIDELAKYEAVDFIITRNLKDFEKSTTEIMNAREAYNYITSEVV